MAQLCININTIYIFISLYLIQYLNFKFVVRILVQKRLLFNNKLHVTDPEKRTREETKNVSKTIYIRLCLL
jgi:hypothetical protein